MKEQNKIQQIIEKALIENGHEHYLVTVGKDQTLSVTKKPVAVHRMEVVRDADRAHIDVWFDRDSRTVIGSGVDLVDFQDDLAEWLEDYFNED